MSAVGSPISFWVSRDARPSAVTARASKRPQARRKISSCDTAKKRKRRHGDCTCERRRYLQCCGLVGYCRYTALRKVWKEVECIPHAVDNQYKRVATLGGLHFSAPIASQTSSGAVTPPAEPRSGLATLALYEQASIASHRPPLENAPRLLPYSMPNQIRMLLLDKRLCYRAISRPDRQSLDPAGGRLQGDQPKAHSLGYPPGVGMANTQS